MTGRARDGRLVHFAPACASLRPGDVVTTAVTDAARTTWSPTTVLTHRRTRAGDSIERGVTPKTPPIGVGLGCRRSARPHRCQHRWDATHEHLGQRRRFR